MTQSQVTSQVPDAGTPMFDAAGYINPVWHSFFFTLLRRTGGSDGIDAQDQAARTTINERRVRDEEAITNSQAIMDVTQDFVPEAFLGAHGLHYDPNLHALATATEAGFMSPADKLKLDTYSYSEGAWTPTLTFTSPGDLAVTYSDQTGTYVRVGRMIVLCFRLTASSFVYTSSSGALSINGVPFATSIGVEFSGTLSFQGITKAGYTQFNATLAAGSSSLLITASSSALPKSQVDASSVPSASTVSLQGTITYFI